MTKSVAVMAAGSMSNAPALLSSSTLASNVESVFNAMAGETIATADERELEVRTALCAAYGVDPQTQAKPYVFVDGVAVIPVHGLLLNRFGGSYGYVTGYTYIRRMRDTAMLDDDVKLIAYDVNSGGGEAAGVFELAQESFELRGTKPSVAIVNSSCYSAAFAFACAADKIYVTPSGGAGSIGVVATHFDVSKMMDNWGVKVTLIHAGDNKVDGNQFAPLPDSVRADIQTRVDGLYSEFVDLVAQNRGISTEAVRKTQARCYSAADALALGLIDAVASPMEALKLIQQTGAANAEKLTAETVQEDLAMEETEVKANERARIKAITACEAAKGRSDLAEHLAYDTDMSAEAAVVLLEKAPLAIAPVAAPAAAAPAVVDGATAAGAQDVPFIAAMNQAAHPEVGADGAVAAATAAGDDKLPSLVACFQEVTGRDLNK